MSTPQPVRAREIVRGVDVEEQELRIAEAPDLGQREDTDRDARVEADGAEVAGVEAWRRWPRGRPDRRRRRAARRRGGRRSRAAWRRASSSPSARARTSATDTNGMSQATQTTGAGRLDHRGVDPAQRAESRPHVGHDPEVGAPGRRVRRVGHQQRRLARAPRSASGPAGRGSARRRPSPGPWAGRRTGWPRRPASTAPRGRTVRQ